MKERGSDRRSKIKTELKEIIKLNQGISFSEVWSQFKWRLLEYESTALICSVAQEPYVTASDFHKIEKEVTNFKLTCYTSTNIFFPL